MAFATGAFQGLRYGAQAGFGTPATNMISLRCTSCSIGPPKRDGKESQELTTDRQINDYTLGSKKQSGDFGFEISYGEYDDMLEAMLGGTWAAAYNLTGQTIELNNTSHKLIRGSGSWITDGVQIGDFVTLTGCTTGGNNKTYGPVTVVTALELTIPTMSCTSEAGTGTQTITTSTKKLVNGSTIRYFTFERAFTDIVQYGAYQDQMIDKWTLEAKLDAKVSGKFSTIGSGAASYTAAPIDASPDASQTNDPFESFDGTLKEGGGAALAIVNALSLSADNQGNADYVILNGDDAKAAQLDQGRFKLTGSIDLYFADAAMHTKVIAGTPSSLDFTLGTPVSGKAYRIYLPKIKYTGIDDPATNDKTIMLKVPFSASKDPTTGKTIQIWKFPGA